MIFYISVTGRFLNSSPSLKKVNEYNVYCILNIIVRVYTHYVVNNNARGKHFYSSLQLKQMYKAGIYRHSNMNIE